MKVCLNCNSELPDNARFCTNCGTPVPEDTVEEVPAVQPETEVLQEAAVAQEAPVQPEVEAQPKITEAAAAEVEVESIPLPETEEAPEAPKKAIPKKAIMLGAIAIAAVAVIAIIIALLSGGKGKENNFLLYLKDEEIFYSDLGKDLEGWQLTSHLIDSDIEVDSNTFANFTDSGYALGIMTHMSNDGKTLFFPDKIGENDEGFNLYYRDVTDEDAETVKVDSDVISYQVNESTKVVTYRKGKAGNLYQYTLKSDDKSKIANDVAYFYASEDGNKIIYMNTEGSVYVQYMDKEDKEKIANDVSNIVHLTEDLKTLYYLKEGTLYKQVEGEDKVKIASDVYDVLEVYDSGEVYYTKSSTREIALTDYVDDDMKDTDAAMKLPTRPSYPSWWDYDTNEEYNKAYDEYEKAYDKYEEDYKAYWEKEQRDSIRENLEGEVIEHTDYALYYYDGEEDTVLTKNFSNSYSGYYTAADAAVIVYTSISEGSVDKVKLSELSGAYEVADKVREALAGGTETNLAVKGNSTEIDAENATSFRINGKGTLIYYVSNIKEGENHGDLYNIAIKGDKISDAELYDEDVYTYGYFLSEDDFLYFKDYEEDSGDMYINKESIDYDVRLWSVDYNMDSETVLYITDWDSDKEYGTLKIWDGKEAVKIADDANSPYMLPDGRVLYLYDYSTKHHNGELRIWKNGESEKIDDDVICIIPVYDINQKGITNY